MRPIRKITAEEENFRMVPFLPEQPDRFVTPKRDPVEPEPVGTILLLPFRITGYDQDCDGSLMGRLENLYLHKDRLDSSGWDVRRISVSDGLVVTESELIEMLDEK